MSRSRADAGIKGRGGGGGGGGAQWFKTIVDDDISEPSKKNYTIVSQYINNIAYCH